MSSGISSGATVFIPATSLSVSDNKLLSQLKTFPNPVYGDFYHIEANEVLSFQIIDLLGKTIKTGQVSPSNQAINVSNLNKGLYILKLETNNQNITKKIIKL